MAGFTKLFSDLIESSIWEEDSDTCKVWITLLCLCNQDGYVRGSPGWLASKARVTPEKCQEALWKFASRDTASRTVDHDGRRIEVLADGWLILNYIAFRDRLSDSESATSSRERVRKHRERYRALRNVTTVTGRYSASASASVSELSIPEGESERARINDGEPPWKRELFDKAAIAAGVSQKDAEACWSHYDTQGWRLGNQMPITGDPRSLLVRWLNNPKRNGEVGSGIGGNGQGRNGKPMTQWEIQQALEAIPKAIKIADDAQDWEKTKKLRARQKELEAMKTGVE